MDMWLVRHVVWWCSTGTHYCTYTRRDGQAEFTSVAGYIPRWFTHQQTDAHTSGSDVEKVC